MLKTILIAALFAVGCGAETTDTPDPRAEGTLTGGKADLPRGGNVAGDAPTSTNLTISLGTACVGGQSYSVTRTCSTTAWRMTGGTGCWDTWTPNNQSCSCGGGSSAQSC